MENDGETMGKWSENGILFEHIMESWKIWTKS